MLAAVNQQYLDHAICELEEGTSGYAHAVKEKALDDIEQGIGLSEVYQDTNEMFRDISV